MHAADLADEIYKRGLYFKKNGTKAEYTQISARANNYKDWFEKIGGNEIKLVRRV
jgi:antitoxin Phd